jgi:hypothetical protein
MVPAVPSAPVVSTAVNAGSGSPRSGQIFITVTTPAAANNSTITMYKAYPENTTNIVAWTTAPTLDNTDGTGLHRTDAVYVTGITCSPAGVGYAVRWRVSAVNAIGEGPVSNWITNTVTSQTGGGG